MLLGFRSHLIRVHAGQLEQYLAAIGVEFIEAFSGDDKETHEAIQELCLSWGRRIDRRLTFILPDGEVVGESQLDPGFLDNHFDRPEISGALLQGSTSSVRYSDTVQQRMIYTAVALRSGERLYGVLRASTPVARIIYPYGSFGLVAGPVFLLMLSVGVAVLALVLRKIKRLFAGLENEVLRFRDSGYAQPLSVRIWKETEGIIDSINSMGMQLRERINFASRQRTVEKAILANMVEGVLAIDSESRIIDVNEAAARLLRVSRKEALHHRIEEVVRISDILEFIQKTMESSTILEEDLQIYDEKERFLRVHGTKLLDSAGKSIGALVVLYDNTQLHRLELVRKEFAANVSHELKTPITSIKGFSETLLDGGLEDRADAMRFLSIIAQQSNRLIAIVDDLLSLARIEENLEQGEVALSTGRLRGVLDSAASTCQRRAAERNIDVRIECPYDVSARFNPQLLEQALVNLMDNAIKHSEPGGGVEVSVENREGLVCIAVKDHGCGIAREYIPRLFERFYRVDKARSRALGGTGLGLAIVKHIVLSHRGNVEVESEEGEGSTFTICLPEPRETLFL